MYQGYNPSLMLGADVDILGNVDIMGADERFEAAADLLGMDPDILGFSLKSALRTAVNPLSLITDRVKMPAAARAVLDPTSLLTSRGRSAAPAKAAVAQAMAQRGALVQQHEPTQSRRLSLPVDSGATVAAGATQVITVNPVGAFRGEVFSIDPICAPSFIITQILVGRHSQLAGGGAVAATLYSANAPLSMVQWDTAQANQPILITVTNTSGAAVRFMGQVNGTIVE